jgi:hypothetical protein
LFEQARARARNAEESRAALMEAIEKCQSQQ